MQVYSLIPEDSSTKYHLLSPTFSLNEPFLKGFTQDSKGPTKQMKHWWVDEDETIKQGQKLVPTHMLKNPYKLLVAMLCHLYREEKCTHFQIVWLNLAHNIIRMGHIFNWVDILSFNVCLHVNNLPGMKKPCFICLLI
jgi:hypothetical protein